MNPMFPGATLIFNAPAPSKLRLISVSLCCDSMLLAATFMGSRETRERIADARPLRGS